MRRVLLWAPPIVYMALGTPIVERSDELHTTFCAVDAHGSRATGGVESGHGRRRTRSIGSRQAYLRRSADAARRREAPRDRRWGALRDAVPVHEASAGVHESDADIRPIPRPSTDRVPVCGVEGFIDDAAAASARSASRRRVRSARLKASRYTAASRYSSISTVSRPPRRLRR